MSSDVAAFIRAACVPMTERHGSGTLDDARALLRENPALATAGIYAAAILADEATVRRFIAADPSSATGKGGPHNWDALTHLCFSKYLRLDAERADAFVRTAEALIDAGADPNTGWFEASHQPKPEWESVVYGAAGIANHAGLTRLLLARGADPNDDETPYHAPERYDNAALEALVESGRLNADSLTTMLLRKADWHDEAGIRHLLANGADPNRATRWGYTALQQAIRRDNSVEIITSMLDAGADPIVPNRVDGRSSVAMALRRGRQDLGDLFASRRLMTERLWGVDRVLAACVGGDANDMKLTIATEKEFVRDLMFEGGDRLAEFAGVGNTAGVGRLLDLGVPVDALYAGGDPYFDIAPDSTALHVAAWRARPGTVRLLIERGAPVDAYDARARTALDLAIKACVDSHWTERRSPASVEALLRAGASAKSVKFPCGYGPVDDLLRAARGSNRPT